MKNDVGRQALFLNPTPLVGVVYGTLHYSLISVTPSSAKT